MTVYMAESCTSMADLYGLQRLSLRCTEWYSPAKEDNQHYHSSWSTLLNLTDDQIKLTNLDKAYIYKVCIRINLIYQ